MNRYKLNVRLIPKSAYGQNMRSVMSSREWRDLSDYVRSVQVCAGCWKRFDKTRLEAHEEWVWKLFGEQVLRRIVPLCKKCHHTVHIGRANACNEYEEAQRHYMQVRHVSQGKFNQIVNEEWKRWDKRSKIKWHLVTTPEDAWRIAKEDRQLIEKLKEKHPPKN